MQYFTDLLEATLRVTAPILLAGLGQVFTYRAGVVNIGVEGTMLIGTLAAVIGSYYSGSPLMGALLAMVTGMVISLAFSYLVVHIRANQVVIGTAINIMALGLTTAVFRIVFEIGKPHPNIAGFERIALPGLSQLPVVGEALFRQGFLVYLSLFLVPISHYFLFRTPLGLRIRAVGEYPRAADTVGVHVYFVRYGCIILGGALAGLAGASLSLGVLNRFSENMVAGRGFIAMAAVVFGRWSPIGCLVGSLLFGLGDAFQLRLQAYGLKIPYQFLLMVPYLLTIGTIAASAGRLSGPAAIGVPYKKE